MDPVPSARCRILSDTAATVNEQPISLDEQVRVIAVKCRMATGAFQTVFGRGPQSRRDRLCAWLCAPIWARHVA